MPLTSLVTPDWKLAGLPRVGTLWPLTVIVDGNGLNDWSCRTTCEYLDCVISGRSPASLPVLLA